MIDGSCKPPLNMHDYLEILNIVEFGITALQGKLVIVPALQTNC